MRLPIRPKQFSPALNRTRLAFSAGAVQVRFDGLDRPPLDGGPDFVKALAVEHALDHEVMLAWAMSGENLPMLNGYPVRLIVPGYYGTYWVKHLSHTQVVDSVFDGLLADAARESKPNWAAAWTDRSARLN